MKRFYLSMNLAETLKLSIQLAGAGQLVLVLVSPMIPVILKWKDETAKLKPLTRQIFWTYAGYILVTNFWFAVISLAGAHHLINQSWLAIVLTLYMAAYWMSRMVLQLFFLDRSAAPPGIFSKVADGALTALFIYLTACYGTALVWNLGWL